MSTVHPIVNRDHWLEARKALLVREKALTQQREALSAARRALPWVRIDKDYVFDGMHGKCSLLDLFGGHPQLLVYHFMFDPSWEEGCKSCSFVIDHLESARVHLAARATKLVAIAQAPWAKIAGFRQRMGWGLDWVSSAESDFNFDFQVTFDPSDLQAGAVVYNYQVQPFPVSQAPGLSVFVREDAAVFHTYSTYGRGLEALMTTYDCLDLTPLGRHEDPQRPMSWIRHHDKYANP